MGGTVYIRAEGHDPIAIDPSNPVGSLYALAYCHLLTIGADTEIANKLVDIACAQEAAILHERERALSRRQNTEQWYAVRFERLKDLAKQHGIWNEAAAIMANGTADPMEPPTYAGQLNIARHRAEDAEQRAQRAEAEAKRLRDILAAPASSDRGVR